MRLAKLMTNILPFYSIFLEEEARETRRTKREIIEAAIAMYIKEKKKRAIINAYRKMSKDKGYLLESVSTAEIGMDYFLTDINNY